MPVRREAPQPPALWQQAAPVVARGAALVAAGFIGEWLLRSAAKRAASAPFKRSKKTRALARAEAQRRETIAITETVVMRRVIVRR